MADITGKFIKFNEKNKNGRVYVKHEISDIPKPLLGILSHPDGAFNFDPKISEAFALCETEIKDDGVYVSSAVIVEAHNNIVDSLLESGFKLVPCGTGRVDEDGVVRDYKLHYVFLTNDPAWE